MLIKGIERNVTEIISELLETLSQQNQVDIRFDFEGEDSWSVITLFDESDDSQLSLRYYGNQKYLLVAGAYDEDDDFVEVAEALSDAMVSDLPEGCTLLMDKVRDDEKGMRLAGHFLLRKKG
ncbi:MAG: hypothetical protein FGM61_02885 [Sediminibacterium sp.]|nr:hypothetical protein [Sediminibacterium sp.]